ncbi:MAG TPA: ATP-dependent DNA helicase, partial [Gammaproteobacteria bacterium]|nr:ATP-dependent DNA helicase [Gammaproteobacteria bacterium]
REQQELAEAIGRALDHGGILVAEAGTGVGKTFAYLAPVLRAGRRALISTGTRTLQDQIFHRDLPVVRRALGQPVKVALLKGRSNYLCRHRLELTRNEAELRREEVPEFRAVSTWAQRTATGDKAELDAVPEDSRLWARVTSTAENCLGQECPAFSNCFVVKARREAQQADVVVVNHHLLFADMALKEEGFGELLPNIDAVVVDEAHQFPDIAGQYFGEVLSTRQVRELADDALAEYLKSAGDMPAVRPCLDGLKNAVARLRLSLGDRDRRLEWRDCLDGEGFSDALAELATALEEAHGLLDLLAERSRGLDNCRQRAAQLIARVAQFQDEEADGYIRWAETRGRGASLHLTPYDVAARLAEHIHGGDTAWIFTSATLAIGDSVDHFCARAGIEAGERLVLGSPFDYENNALLYLPQGLPAVNRPDYTRAAVDAALPLLEANGGRAFLLFTSHRALREAADYLGGRSTHTLLVQGDAPRSRLIERFRDTEEAVLLGTSSFWEGVDVKGPALSLVVIDKLPFASPGEPVLKARMDALERAGGRPFVEIQLPQAVIALKQGVGRLIRDTADTGVMMLCDPRLTSKSYGRVFLDSLPPMRRSTAREDALAFIRRQVMPA